MNKSVFPKKKRLLKFSEFAFVFDQSTCIKAKGIALLSRFNKLEYPRIGLAISKRYVKRAHERNRIKRYARETFRLVQYSLLSSDYIVIAYSREIIDLKNNHLIREFEKLWNHHRFY